MRLKSRISLASPAPVVYLKAADPSPVKPLPGNAGTSLNMPQANGFRSGARTSSHLESATKNPASVQSSPTQEKKQQHQHQQQQPQQQQEQEASPPETAQWSSAIGHASTTGKSGRVIERLQTDIDRLHREAHALRMRHDEIEKTNETLVTRNQYLQDRNNNYEQSNEATLRQLARKERQVDDLREELAREKERTARALEQARAASVSEGQWREQANKAKAQAVQREAEYEVIASCRNMDNDRHQLGLDKVRDSFDDLLRQRREEREKHKKLEMLAEYQRNTISQLDDLNKRMNANFVSYRDEMDSAVGDMRKIADENDVAMKSKLAEMQQTLDKMRWVMQIEQVTNPRPPCPHTPDGVSEKQQQQKAEAPDAESTKSSSKTTTAMKGRLQSFGRSRLHKRNKSGVSEG